MNEIWKDIKGWEGRYSVSNLGRVKSLPKIIGRPDAKTGNLRKEIILKCNFDLSKNKKAYAKVNLGRGNTRLVHQLVADAFVPNPEMKEMINHIDGNRANNKASNLERATCKENNNHAYKLGLNKPQLQNLKWAKKKTI